MKRTTMTIWQSDAGRELLRRKYDGNYTIPVMDVSRDELRDLTAAIDDAIGSPDGAAIKITEEQLDQTRKGL